MTEKIYPGDEFKFVHDTKNGMLVGPDGCHYDTEAEALYYGVLCFCGCGQPEETHEFALKCLSAFERKDGAEWKDGIKEIMVHIASEPENAAYFIAYVLDNANLTEHGGSVGGSWLTSLGEQFLKAGVMVEAD